MELLVTVTHPGAGGHRGVDLAVDLDALATVAELQAALDAYGSTHQWGLPGGCTLSVLQHGAHRTVDPASTVFDAGILSGDTLVLTEGLPRETAADPPAHEAVTFDVTSGPEMGRTITLGPGMHRVGREADRCEVVVADERMSKQHLAIEVTPVLDVVIHPNLRARNGTAVAGTTVIEPKPLRPDEAVQAGTTHLVLRAPLFAARGGRDRLGNVAFNRMPYRQPIIHDRPLEPLPSPPRRPGQRRFNPLAMLLPLIGSIAIVLVTGRVEFILFAGLSPLMMLSNHFSEGRSNKRTFATESSEFEAALVEREEEVERALVAERQERLTASPDLPLQVRQAAGQLSRLWERNRLAPDALVVRLGLGRQPTLIEAPIASGGDPGIRSDAIKRLAHHDHLDHVPVVAGLDEAVVTGLHGSSTAVAALARAILVQAVIEHSPEELVVAAGVPAAEAPEWDWLKWLPHVRSATSPLEGTHLVDEEGIGDLLMRVGRVAVGRSGSADARSLAWPRLLLVVHQDVTPDPALLSSLLDAARVGGIDVLWVGTDERLLPRQCRNLIHCWDPSEGLSLLRSTDPLVDDQTFSLEGITRSKAMEAARSLAPIRDVSAASATTGIPRVVSLLDALGLPQPDAASVGARWARPRPYQLVGTLGTAANGRFDLDLVAQGPHTLIGGTSGAGKSELLQSLVLSMAVEHSPRQLNFLFIDYKGGASSADFADLPHNVGSVSNLDARLSLRALVSLRAELQHRMELLGGKAKDLKEMIAGWPEEAPPSLVIVVDEFATLVKEIPDFVAGIVDIAQRGRSLGIHLVLATQRPTGAVNDNILANTNLRIALRVLDPADSSAIIGTKEAAQIPVPLRGRAFARNGPGPTTAFQCAWSGAPFEAEAQASPVVVRSFPFVAVAASDTDHDIALDQPDEIVATQLSVTVAACAAAGEQAALPPARRPWVEPLAEVISLDAALVAAAPALAEARAQDPGRHVVIGLGDAPAEQRQFTASVDLEASGGLLIFGSGGSGKTTLLRTIAADVARQGPPSAIQLYVLDFASRSLGHLADLPHTVAVATSDQPELVTRMLTVLRNELERRRDILAAGQAESLSALRRQAGNVVLPRIVVLLDSYANFQQTFEKGADYVWVTALQQLVSEGRQVGIHVVITASRQLGIPAALTSAVSARLVLRMATNEELMGHGVPRAIAVGAELGDGRGFLGSDVEVQVATVSADPSAAAQVAAVHDLGTGFDSHGVGRPAPLPELPAVLRAPARSAHPLHATLGVADLSGEEVEVDLTRESFVIFGGPLSGRSTALATVGLGLASRPSGPAVIALGALTSPLAEIDGFTVRGFGRANVRAAIDEAIAIVGDDEGAEVRVVLLIDAVEDLAEHDSALLPLVRSDAVRIAAVAEPTSITGAYSGWLAELKRNRSVLILQPAGADEIAAITGIKPALRPGQEFPPGRGIYLVRGRPTLIQVAQVATDAERG